jgi:2-oxoglutarate dehydrogenase E2 component (dihydrolipoamide succinyltransferase)
MADVIMPQMGESIAEGTVTKWLKNVGDRVERDEPLFEISTDKVDAEIPSPAAGVLKEIRVAPGATVPIHTVVGVIAVEGEAAATAEPPAAPPPPVPQVVPPVSYQIEGEAPAAPPTPPAAEPAPAPEPVRAAEPPEAPPTPAVQPPPVPVPPLGVPVAAPPVALPAVPVPAVTEATPAAAAGVAVTSAPAAPPEPVGFELQAEKPRAEMTAEELRLQRSSPVVRRIAAEHHVDIREVPGTGIGGRVTKQDILDHIGSREAAGTAAPVAEPTAAPPVAAAPAPATPPVPPLGSTPVAEAAPAAAAPVAPAPAGSRVEVVPMSPIRRKTAEHMLLSKRTSAHVATVFEVDLTRVEQLRQKHRPAFEQRGVKLTYLPFILKAVVDALKAFPVLNASIDGDNVVYHRDVNLGVAVALDWGLIVPVVHHADEKNVLGLARSVSDLADRARAKKLKVEEVQGGTFTITNPGVFGSLFGTPIINQPQVAILAVGTIEKRPVVRDDAIAIRTMAYFALSFDHRLVDGADADRFMAQVKATLQEFDEAAI